jgi:purine-binding chemotaxis protein CheW
MQYLSFRLNGVDYAVDVKIVETVVERSPMTAVPTPVEYMKGVMDLRGRPIPVIDLRRKFGFPECADSGLGCVIVISAEDGEKRRATVGALVDEVSEVITIAEESVESSLAGGADLWERYVRGIIRLEGRMIVLIEAEGLFSIGEIEALRA